MFRFLPSLLILSLIAPLAESVPRQLQCQVIGISDGDSLTCLHNRKPIHVRLQHIDAPELNQAYGKRAKQALAQLVFKQNVRIEASGYDKYQRLLAVVYTLDGKNINLQLIQQGMAWAYQQTQPEYQLAQTQAQRHKIGLWNENHPINPAQWRLNKRSDPSRILQNTPTNRPLVKVDCTVKLSCNRLGSFELAQRYFQQCGWKELDGNRDGIPCNKLYRKAQQQ